MSEEKKKVNEEDLEQVRGGFLDIQAKQWLDKYRNTIEARANEKRNWNKVEKILAACVGFKKKFSLEEFKAYLRRFIEVDDLELNQNIEK